MKEIEKFKEYSEIIPEDKLTEIIGGDWIVDWITLQLVFLEIKIDKYIDSLLETK